MFQIELVSAQDRDELIGYRFMGTAELWKPGDPVNEHTELYGRFAGG